MSDREIYANAPLRLVAAEFRYPYAPKLGGADVLQELTAAFRPRFPIPEQPVQQVVMSVAGEVSQPARITAANKFLSKDRTASVTLTQTNIVIETTEYHGYDSFKPLIAASLEGLGSYASAIVGLERVGLRYINEIRLARLQGPGDWAGYVNNDMMAPLHLLEDREPALFQAVVQTELADNIALVLRYGALRGQVVSPVGPLKVAPVPAEDPFFLIDIDSSWVSGEAFDNYSLDAALDICDRLHEPIDDLFERAITDRLRDEVLRIPA